MGLGEKRFEKKGTNGGDNRGDKKTCPPDSDSAKKRHIFFKSEAQEGCEPSLEEKLREFENRRAKQTVKHMEAGVVPSDGRRMPDVQVYSANTDRNPMGHAISALQNNPDILNSFYEDIQNFEDQNHNAGDIRHLTHRMNGTISRMNQDPRRLEIYNITMKQLIVEITRNALDNYTSSMVRGRVYALLRQIGIATPPSS